MGKGFFVTILIYFVFTVGGWGQTILLNENFETDGNGTRYTIFGGFSDNVGDYFVRTDGNGTVDGYKKPSNLPVYTGQDSTFFFAGEDTENSDNPNTTTSGVVFNDINIAGYDSLVIKGLFACGAKPKFDPPDYMRVLVDMDNQGAWSLVGAFEADISSGTNSSIFGLDTDFDGIQDSTLLDTAFKEFSFPVSGSGSLIDIKIELYLTAGDEEAGFDFIRLTGRQTGDIIAPGNFVATTLSASEIDLSWNLNANNDSALVAFSSQPGDGNPVNGVYYSPGDSVPGGLTVLYRGNGNSFHHTSRSPGVTYYYKAWSIHSGSYSSGVGASSTTALSEPTSYPDSFRVELSGLNAVLKWVNPLAAPGVQQHDGYLIIAGTDSNLTVPVDGVVVPQDSVLGDGQASKYVWGDNQSYVFSRLGLFTTYYFKIFPFTNSGTLIDYKTSGTPPACQATTGNRTVELFFSEYVEGTSYNKAMELFNPLPDSVDLSHYRIRSASGGGGWSSQFLLRGKIAPRDVFVIAHSSATSAITAMADTALGSGVMAFNGDDARILERSSDNAIWIPLDVIGSPNQDPGSGWSVAGIPNGTQNHTLVRKKTVSCGNIHWSESAGTDSASSEWYVKNQDMTDDLGHHQWELVNIVEPGQSTHVLEGAVADSYLVSLAIQPTSTVVIELEGDAQINVYPGSVNFTPSNWNVPQIVSVTAIDDAEAEGDHSGHVSSTIISEDGFFSVFPAPDLTVMIADNDVAGISVDPNPNLHQIREGGESLVYALVLNTKPTDAVTISLSLSPTGEATVVPESVTFNNQNWNTPQPITLSAIDDSSVEKADTLVLMHQISTGDSNYAHLTIDSVQIILKDNDIYSVIMNEIMYNSQGSDEEWVELYCDEPGGINFNQDWVLSNTHPSWRDTFQTGLVLNQGEYFTIKIGTSGNFPFSPDMVGSATANQLNNTSSTLKLIWDNRVVDSVSYKDSNPWPTGADGQGYSLELKSVTLDNAFGSNWQASYLFGGTPGQPNSKDTTGPKVISIQISDSNSHVDIGFSEGVFSSDSGVGGLNRDCFSIEIFGGIAGNPTIDTLIKVDGTSLVGGEAIIRTVFSYTNTANGNETLQIHPVKNRIFDAAGNSASESQSVSVVTLHDQLSPALVLSTPKDDSVGVDIASTIGLWFSENIYAGPGSVALKRYTDLTLVESFSADSGVTIKGNQVTIQPTNLFQYNTPYCLMIDDTAFSDLDGNYFNGIQDRDSMNFTTGSRINTAPWFTSGEQQDSFQVTVSENQKTVLTLSAEDAEGDALSYSLEGGEDKGLFQIDTASGVLEFIVAPDFEQPADFDSNNIYVVTAEVTDDAPGSLSDSQTIVVHVTDVDEEAPELVNTSPAIGATAVPVNTSITVIFSEDVFPDSGGVKIYRYSDEQLILSFDIVNNVHFDSTVLSVKIQDALDYETSYYVTIDSSAVTDLVGNHYGGIQDKDDFYFTTIQKPGTAPVITSGGGADSIALRIPENQKNVTVISATDGDGDTLEYRLTGGLDMQCFTIDRLSGELWFNKLPDFENPLDSDKDNHYHCIVTVSDPGGLVDKQIIEVIVTDVDEISPSLTFKIQGSSFNTVTNQNPIPLVVLFSEKIAAFNFDSIAVSNGVLDTANCLFIAGEDSVHLSVTPSSEGTLMISICDGAARDMADNPSLGAMFMLRYDQHPPIITLSSEQKSVTNDSLIRIVVHFSERILSFTQTDLKSEPECRLSAFLNIDSQDYLFQWAPDQETSYHFYIESATVSDSAGNQNEPSDTLVIAYDISVPSFIMGTPERCQEDSDGFSFSVCSNEDGYAWFSVFTDPNLVTDPQVLKTGTGQTSVLHGMVEVRAQVIDTITVGSLEWGNDYHVCIVLEDLAGNLSNGVAVLNVWKLGVRDHLFFSEYLEGSGDNKAVEIYNPADVDIALRDYRLSWWNEGVGWADFYSFPDTMVIRGNNVIVLINNGLDTSLFIPTGDGVIFSNSKIVSFDGNDARALMVINVKTVGADTLRDTTVLDVIGDPADPQGSGWTVAGFSNMTKDHTLIRKPRVRTGVKDWSRSSGANIEDSEWIIYPKDYTRNLGSHTQSDDKTEIYFTGSSFDTIDYQGELTWLLPDLDIQGLSPNAEIVSGSIHFLGWKQWEDSISISTCGNIRLNKKVPTNESIEYLLRGYSPCSDYLQTLKTLSYSHRPLACTDHLVEFWVIVRTDSLESYPLCRVLSVVPKPLSTVHMAEPRVFKLSQNYPNPFNPVTRIDYELPVDCYVSLQIFNLHGERVCSLEGGLKSAGRYSLQWFGNNERGEPMSSGVYLYRLRARSVEGSREWMKARKLVYLK